MNIIINDGQFQWPADAEAVRKWASERNVAVGKPLPSDPEGGGIYADLCNAVQPLDGLKVGTQECIDRCKQAIESGAYVWYV